MSVSETNIFELASRLKLRFTTEIGPISSEDLWNLPLTSKVRVSLDELAKSVNRGLKDSEEESFVKASSVEDQRQRLKLDILKRVIEVRLEENRLARDAKERADKKQKVLGILARKKDAALEELSEEDLEKMAASL